MDSDDQEESMRHLDCLALYVEKGKPDPRGTSGKLDDKFKHRTLIE